MVKNYFKQGALLVGVASLFISGTASATTINPQGGINISNGNFTNTGSAIFDNGELTVATDNYLFLQAPVRVTVSNDLAVQGGLQLFNGSFANTGSRIYDDAEMHIKTDNFLYLDAPIATFVQSDMQVGGAVTGASFSGVGTGLTALSASNLSSGTVADARLSTAVTLQGNLFNGANQLVKLDASSQLPVASGVNLTALNASSLASGTVSDTRLSANVALRDAANTFSAAGTALTVTNAASVGTTLAVAGVSSLNGGAKIGTSGTTITQLQSGTGTCGTAVSFPAAFGAAPRVVATINTDPGVAGVTSGVSLAAFSATTTGFSNACRNNDGSANVAATFSWIANN